MVRSGTAVVSITCCQPVGQADVWSDVPHPHMPPQCPRERHLVAKSGRNLGPVDLNSCLLFAIDHLEFSRVLCNRLSSIFVCNTAMSPKPPATPPYAPTPPPVQVYSGQE